MRTYPGSLMLSLALLLTLTGCGRPQAGAASTSPAASTTDIEITKKARVQGVKRFGINLGGQNFYDSGQMLRNLIFRNPGFEGESWRSILRCKSATATTCREENQYTVWPDDFLKGAHFEFLTGPAAGLSGMVQSSRRADGSSGITFDFPPLAHTPTAGDFVLVHFDHPGDADKGWWTNTMHSGATLATEFHDLAPNTPGKQALRIDAAGPGQSARLDSYFDTYDGRSFLTLKGRYTLTFRAKGAGGNNLLTVGLIRAGNNSPDASIFPSRPIRLTNQWRDYTYDLTATETGARTGHLDLSFTVAGAIVLLDDVSLTAAAAPSNPTAFRNEVVDTLRELQPGILRFNDTGTDAASTLDNMLAPVYARQRAAYSTQSTTQEELPLGLHEALVLAQVVHAEPWYALPASLSPQDAKNLIEYLAGPASTPYGAKRVALGQPQPWTQVFPLIHLEFGNELWNAPTFYGAAMQDAAAYGRRAAQLFTAARSSAFYDSGKFDLVLGSQAVNPWWTGQELAHSSGYDSVAVAPYLFNQLNDSGSSEAIFGPMFAEPEMIDSDPHGYMAQQSKAAHAAPHSARLEVYEVNLGTDQATGDVPQSVIDSTVPSAGAGIAVVEHMLLMLRDLGITTQSTYALSGYSNKFRNPEGKPETTWLWGTVLDMGGPTNRRRPVFLAEQLANQAMHSTLLETRITGANPTWNQPRSPNNDIALKQAHTLQAFAFEDGAQHSLIVFNLDRQDPHRITLSGANAPHGPIDVTQLAPAHITDNNEHSEQVHAVHTVLAALNAQSPYALPPFSMTVLAWSAAP